MVNKILIVDDEPSITVPLKFLMEQRGHLGQRLGQAADVAQCTFEHGPVGFKGVDAQQNQQYAADDHGRQHGKNRHGQIEQSVRNNTFAG